MMPAFTVVGIVDTHAPVTLTVAGVLAGVAPLVDDEPGPPRARRWSGVVEADDPHAAELVAASLAAREFEPIDPLIRAGNGDAVTGTMVPGITAETWDGLAAHTAIAMAADRQRIVVNGVARAVAYWWAAGQRAEIARLGDGEPFRPAVVLTEVDEALAQADPDQIRELCALRGWLLRQYGRQHRTGEEAGG